MFRILISPRKAQLDLAARGFGEQQILGLLFVVCVTAFFIRLPAFVANTNPDISLEIQVAAFFVACMIFAPLFLYLVAALSRLVLVGFGRKIDWMPARLVIFSTLLIFQPVIAVITFGAKPTLGAGPASAISLAVLMWLLVAIWQGAGAYSAKDRLASETV